MKNAFDGLTSRLDTTEQRISELDNISKESLKTKSKEDKDWKTEQNIQVLWENHKKYGLCHKEKNER